MEIKKDMQVHDIFKRCWWKVAKVEGMVTLIGQNGVDTRKLTFEEFEELWNSSSLNPSTKEVELKIEYEQFGYGKHVYCNGIKSTLSIRQYWAVWEIYFGSTRIATTTTLADAKTKVEQLLKLEIGREDLWQQKC